MAAKKTAVANTKTKAVSTSVIDFEADAGKGMENVDKDSIAIPFIQVLQGLSPQLETVKGAKIGQFINTVTNELFDSIDIVPCAFQRNYLKWNPRSKGGGFRGMMSVAEYNSLEAAGQIKEVKDEKGGKSHMNSEGEEILDTRIHFILQRMPDGSVRPAILSLSKSGIKKSKRLIALIDGIRIEGKNGSFCPASYSHVYHLEAVKEKNEKGTWYSIEPTLLERVGDMETYEAGKKLYEAVMKGSVEMAPPVDDGGEGEGF